ncbi:MAG: hypothetical protein RRX93_01715 [Bacteroidales bacterium]
MKKLQAENTQLKNDIIQSDSLQIQFMNAYAEIEYNLNQIKVREKMISENSHDAETNPNIQQKIINDITEIGKLMEENREKIYNMQSLRKELIAMKKQNVRLKNENSQLKNGILPKEPSTPILLSASNEEQLSYYKSENQRLNILNKSLETTISRLQTQVAESEARIESLQEELSLLKDAYAALQAINEDLKAENNRYKLEMETKDSEIETLSEVVNVAYYITGTGKELKSKGLLEKKSINPNFKESNFTKIQNIQEKRIIETNAKKITLISSHPTSSYSINKKDAKNLKIEIKNPDQFWKGTRYLIVETK